MSTPNPTTTTPKQSPPYLLLTASLLLLTTTTLTHRAITASRPTPKHFHPSHFLPPRVLSSLPKHQTPPNQKPPPQQHTKQTTPLLDNPPETETPDPTPYVPSDTDPVNGTLEAVKAMGYATLNLAAVGLMVVGGLGWAFDVGEWRGVTGRVRKWRRGRRDGVVGVGVEEEGDGGERRREEEREWGVFVGGVLGGREKS